jgi:hypothetical protein
MGLGIQSAFQASSAGNNSLATVRKLVKAVLAEKGKKDKKKAKKLKKDRFSKEQGKASGAVQLPRPIEPQGIGR